jgi:hypothetical protein
MWNLTLQSVLAGVIASLTLAAQPGLTVQVIEGQGAIHNVRRGSAFEPVVEVQDAAGKPLPGASVTFTLPAIGPSATFADGSRTLMIQTDANGRASARGLRPNTTIGPFEIRVRAALGGATGTAVIAQTNAAPAKVERASSKKWVILGIVGAAVAGGIAASASGGSSGAAARPSDPPAPPSGSVTPGTPGFGPPQ